MKRLAIIGGVVLAVLLSVVVMAQDAGTFSDSRRVKKMYLV